MSGSNSPWWELSSCLGSNYVEGNFPGGTCTRGNCPRTQIHTNREFKSKTATRSVYKYIAFGFINLVLSSFSCIFGGRYNYSPKLMIFETWFFLRNLYGILLSIIQKGGRIMLHFREEIQSDTSIKNNTTSLLQDWHRVLFSGNKSKEKKRLFVTRILILFGMY